MNSSVCKLTPNRDDQGLIKIFAVEVSLDKACYSGIYFFRINFFTKYFGLEYSFLWACVGYFPYLIKKKFLREKKCPLYTKNQILLKFTHSEISIFNTSKHCYQRK